MRLQQAMPNGTIQMEKTPGVPPNAHPGPVYPPRVALIRSYRGLYIWRGLGLLEQDNDPQSDEGHHCSKNLQRQRPPGPRHHGSRASMVGWTGDRRALLTTWLKTMVDSFSVTYWRFVGYTPSLGPKVLTVELILNETSKKNNNNKKLWKLLSIYIALKNLFFETTLTWRAARILKFEAPPDRAWHMKRANSAIRNSAENRTGRSIRGHKTY